MCLRLSEATYVSPGSVLLDCSEDQPTRAYFNGQLCHFSAVVKWKLELIKVNCAVVVLAG